MSFVLQWIFVCRLFSDQISWVSCCNCTCPLPRSRRSNQAESTHLLAASVQGNTLNSPWKIIFKSKGNINFIIIPGINFDKNLKFFRNHPIFSCFTYLKEATFLLPSFVPVFDVYFSFWFCVLYFVIGLCWNLSQF